MGIESVDLGASTAKKVTFAGEAGYQGAWDASSPTHHVDRKISQEITRDAAINSADLEELQGAVDRLTSIERPDTTTLEALARVRAKIDEMLKKQQN